MAQQIQITIYAQSAGKQVFASAITKLINVNTIQAITTETFGVADANATIYFYPAGYAGGATSSYQVGESMSALLAACNTDTTPSLDVVNNLTVGGIFKVNGTPQTLTGAGAVNLTTYSTLLVTTGANALTLAAGAEGQFKFIKMKTDGGDGTLTVTNLQGGTTITFNDAGDFVHLFYLDAKWNILANSGCTVA